MTRYSLFFFIGSMYHLPGMLPEKRIPFDHLSDIIDMDAVFIMIGHNVLKPGP
jgi:hypothetical protein